MLISVIIPVYQAAASLEKCVNSIPDEYRGEVEIILVDDGSTDGSAELCDELAAKSEGIRAFHQPNSGVAAARNLGIEKSASDYLMFLDADDEFIPEKWEIIFSYAKRGLDFVAFSYYSWFENGKLVEEPFENPSDDCGRDEFMNVLLGTPLLHTCWGKLFKRDLIEKYSLCFPVGIKIGEDYIFVMEYCKHIKNQALVNECILKYYQNSEGAMGHFNVDERIYCLDYIWSYCKRYVAEDNMSAYRDVMCEYQLLAAISVLRFLAEGVRPSDRYSCMKKLLNSPAVMEIAGAVSADNLSGRRKLEYMMVRKRKVLCSTFYFSTKALLVKAKNGGKR